MHRNTF